MSAKFTKTATELGMKVGDKFVAGVDNGGFAVGTIVTLVEDDGSRSPRFDPQAGPQVGPRRFAYAEAMIPLKVESTPEPLKNFIIDVNDVETTVKVGKLLSADQLKRIIEILGE